MAISVSIATQTGTAVPERFWVFADKLDAVTQHNLQLTHQISSGGIPLDDSGNFSKSPYSSKGALLDPLEVRGEELRAREFPQHVSRLVGMYAFGSYGDALLAHQTHGWDLDELTEFVAVSPIVATRVNMEFVSVIRGLHEIHQLTEQRHDDLWRAYWSGASASASNLDPGPQARCIWEWIILGHLWIE